MIIGTSEVYINMDNITHFIPRTELCEIEFYVVSGDSLKLNFRDIPTTVAAISAIEHGIRIGQYLLVLEGVI